MPVAVDVRWGGVRLGHSTDEAGEQWGEGPRGVGGVKDRGQREADEPKNMPDTAPGKCDTGGSGPRRHVRRRLRDESVSIV